MILRIRSAEVCGPHALRLEFSDGERREVDLLPILDGPIFGPLRAPEYFALVSLDPTCGTVVWPNGADFAPEALHGLGTVEGPTAGAVGAHGHTADESFHFLIGFSSTFR